MKEKIFTHQPVHTKREQSFFQPGLHLNKKTDSQNNINIQKCAACDEEKLQRKENSNENMQAESETENYISTLNNKGNFLSKKTNHFFSQKMGYDFSNVKIHTDSIAAKSAQNINSRAYTTGNNIVFNENQFQPETEHGKKLLAHELTHVVQQSNALQLKTIQCKRELDITNEGEKKIYEECLKKIDEAIKGIEENSKKEGMPADIKETAELLRQKFKDNKIKCYYLDGRDGGVTNFSTGEIYMDAKYLEGSPGTFANIGEGTVLHEGTHALHNKKFPKATGKYGKALEDQEAGKESKLTEKEYQNIQRLKAYTEYWAYRKMKEYNNVKFSEKKTAETIHSETMADSRVKKELIPVRKFDPKFDPTKWKPAG